MSAHSLSSKTSPHYNLLNAQPQALFPTFTTPTQQRDQGCHLAKQKNSSSSSLHGAWHQAAADGMQLMQKSKPSSHVSVF